MLEERKLNQDISLYKRDTIFKKDTYINDKSLTKSLSLCIHLKGNSKMSVLDTDYNLNIKEDYTLIDVVNNYESSVEIAKGTHKRFVAFSIPKEFLKKNLPLNNKTDKLFEFFIKDKTIENISNQKTNLKSQFLAWELFNNPYKNELDKLYTESKTLELIHNEFSKIFLDQNNEQKIKFSKEDKQAIYHAKQILTNDLANPPSIKNLARQVAINQLKLKVGFRRFFNETPYNIFLEYRLQEAKKLLNTSEMNIGEIAEHIGYKYTASFTKAFTKRFGIPPKELMKKREYYY